MVSLIDYFKDQLILPYSFVCNDKISKSDMESILSLFGGKLKNENFCDKSDGVDNLSGNLLVSKVS